MGTGEYVVLRAKGKDAFRDVLGTEALERAEDVRASDLQVETERLTRSDLHEMRRDAGVMGVAELMPVALVAPVATTVAEAAATATAWGIDAVGAAQSQLTGSGIRVAVLDTGIDATHPAFSGVDIVQKDFTGEGDGDQNGHGTHCAGTIFGQVVDGFRFGIAPGVEKALIGKVLDGGGRGSTKGIFQALLWCAAEEAHVISMSLGLDFPGLVDYWVGQGMPADLATSRALQAYRQNVDLFGAIAGLARTAGAVGTSGLLVAAAGNESKRDLDPNYEIAVGPPAAGEGVVAVGAVGRTGTSLTDLRAAYFSNTGPLVSGPGVDITSAKAGGGFATMSGTSMATPHVAGAAVLWAQKLLDEMGRVDHDQLVARLVGQASLDPIAPDEDREDVGAGLVKVPAN